jgi:Reverse transcriptase (RNA-dependent DNA polymerase)./Integrase core domain.
LARYLGGSPLISDSQVLMNGLSLSSSSLLDTGADGYVFMSLAFAKKALKVLNLEKITGFPPQVVGGYKGEGLQLVDVALEGTLSIQGKLFNKVHFLVIDMKNDLIIGRKFFDLHDILVDCRRRQLIFPESVLPVEKACDIEMDDAAVLPNPRKKACLVPDADGSGKGEYALSLKDTFTLMKKQIAELEKLAGKQAASPEAIRPPASPRVRVPEWEGKELGDRELREMEDDLHDRRPFVPIAPLRRRKSEARERPFEQRDARGPYVLKRDGIGWYRHHLDIGGSAGIGWSRISSIEGVEISETNINEIEHFIQNKRENALRAEQLPDDEETLRRLAFEQVPKEYHDLIDVFSKVESDQLPPRRPGVDHDIKLTGDPHELGFSPLYKMSLEELEACRDYIHDNLHKGFLEPSVAPWAAPILFAIKPGGGLRFCVDYRKLNAITEKNVCPLPLIEETMARITKAKFFTKIDIRQAFHRIRMAEGTEDLTTFRTRYGTFRFKVLPFGLTNGPATFQAFINSALQEFLDRFCSAYMDDILIWSDTLEEHREHVRQVLHRLREHGLQADLKKCEFHVQTTKFLGFIIGTTGVAVDPEKTDVVRHWKQPTNVRGVQSFLGFCNFYRKFVPEYSRLAQPLTSLTKKDTVFRWSEDCQAGFNSLKDRLLEAPVLKHFDHDLRTRVETDASDGVIAGVLSQEHDDGWHPVAFYSKTMCPAELNYGIHDKELLAVVRALETWRAELIGLQRKEAFEVITDHKALEYFSTKRLLNMRQAGWNDTLAGYCFTITYRPGTENAAADALTRRAEETVSQKMKREQERTIQIFRQASKEHPKAPVKTETPEAPHEVARIFTLRVAQVASVDVFRYEAIHALHRICDIEARAEVPDADDDTEDVVADVDNVVDDNSSVVTDTESGKDIPPSLKGMLLADKVLKANKTSALLEPERQRAGKQEGPWKFTDEGYLLKSGRLVVPTEDPLLITEILREVHSRITTAHPGRSKTRKLVARLYWWPGLYSDVDRFVDNCECRPSKAPRDKTPGLLHPIPIPQRQGQHLIMDFKALPAAKNGKHEYDNALVIVDCFSKRSWTIPCTTKATAVEAAKMFYDGPYRSWGLPLTIGSDRGPQFVADFTDEVAKILNIDWKLSSAGHSQSAGQAEIMNQFLDQRLRPFVNHSRTTGQTPFPPSILCRRPCPTRPSAACRPGR